MTGCVLKLGGSVITYKDASVPRLRTRTVRRIARQIASVPVGRRPKVLVHGAGSFGHLIVARTKIHKRVSGARWLADWAETQILQNELNARICRVLLEAGLPAAPFQPSAAAWTREGELAGWGAEPLQLMVSRGLLPVLFGVPCVDEKGGCRILSGDVLAPAAARAVGVSWVVHGTDVDGVFDRDPKKHPDARKLDRITRKNWERVRSGLTGSQSVDVTGGMAEKVGRLIQWAKKRISSRIVNAATGNDLKKALRGEPVGTEVRW